ncbi:small nuclear ribonucleo D3 [Fusarium albosuccineum]|uniref:Small nuclear ribonucleo D3 n=1 Tax=Fusarium albosuccineum TaxID=1237068 RepID=A0A8H4LJH0_9HYPO|nr:small nuclear ribonucleo D3 [Fusarium albosuccineum]
MDEATDARQSQKHAPKTQQSGTAATTQWSEWVLESSKLYYYRARYISHDEASKVTPNGRNSLVPHDGDTFIHYEFKGVNDTAKKRVSSLPTPELSTCTTPTTADNTTSSKKRRASRSRDHDYVSGRSTGGGMMMSGALVEEEPVKTMVISKSKSSKRHSMAPRKKDRKKLEVDKRKQISTNAKVNKWLDAL